MTPPASDQDAKLAAELQAIEMRLTEEHSQMHSTYVGCACMFVRSVLKTCQRLNEVLGSDDGICAGSNDEMVYMIERMLKCRETFASSSKDITLDLGFHFTSTSAMEHIKSVGLMTKKDRKSNPKLSPEESGNRHGQVFGDGVYTGNYPADFKRYGSKGIIQMRLQGNVRRVQPEEVKMVER